MEVISEANTMKLLSKSVAFAANILQFRITDALFQIPLSRRKDFVKGS